MKATKKSIKKTEVSPVETPVEPVKSPETCTVNVPFMLSLIDIFHKAKALQDTRASVTEAKASLRAAIKYCESFK